MDLRKIKKLVEILEASDLAEIEIQENDEAIRLSRFPSGDVSYPAPPPAIAPVHYAPAPGAAPAPPAEPDAAGSGDAGEDDAPDGYVVRSPMVGTFYNAPNPDSEPFVRVGQEVKAGDTVCIIEAMKMFNQIESDVDGKIVAVLVDNAQPVEFEQPLFIIR